MNSICGKRFFHSMRDIVFIRQLAQRRIQKKFKDLSLHLFRLNGEGVENTKTKNLQFLFKMFKQWGYSPCNTLLDPPPYIHVAVDCLYSVQTARTRTCYMYVLFCQYIGQSLFFYLLA